MNKRNYLKTLLGTVGSSLIPFQFRPKEFKGEFDDLDCLPFFGDSILKFYNKGKMEKMLYFVQTGPIEHRKMYDITSSWRSREEILGYKFFPRKKIHIELTYA